jgi:hypothetical protein
MPDPIHWGADVKVSMPQPLDDSNSGIVPMDGFTFTYSGLFHDLSRADWERLAVPSFAPAVPTSDTVRYDTALDVPGVKGS